METTRSRVVFRVCRLPWVLALGLLACASGPPPGPTPLQIAGMQAKAIVIAPLNLASSLPGELEGSSKLVMDALVEHLQAHGKTVRILGFRLGRNLWREAIRQVKAAGKAPTFENATHFFALEVREKAEFDVLIIPTLYVQNAKVRGTVGRWDGRKQNIKTSGKRPIGARWMVGTLYVKAASIMIFMVDARGEDLHSNRHGLELIQHIEWEAKSMGLSEGDRPTEVNMVSNQPALADRELIYSGVAEAIEPFLPIEVPALLEPGSAAGLTSETGAQTGDAAP